MGLFDLFLNRKKKSFNTKRTNDNFSKDELMKALEEYDDPTFKMFQAIDKYNKTKNTLIEKGTFTEVELSQSEIISIINEFFKNTIDALPIGIIIPIQTSLTIDGVNKSLLIGKDLMCVGKFLSETTGNVKTGLKKQHEVAILIDSSKISDHEDFATNIRVSVEPDDRILNLSSEEFLPDKWSVCRFSTIELNFDKCDDSRMQVDVLEDITLASNILKSLPSLDSEVTEAITKFLGKKQNYLSSTLKEETETSKNDSNTNDESPINTDAEGNSSNEASNNSSKNHSIENYLTITSDDSEDMDI